MKDWLQGFEIFNSAPWAICVAIIACIAKQAHQGWPGTKIFIRKLIVSVFVGMIVAWGLDGTSYSMEIRGAFIGGAVFSSDTIIDPLMRKIVELINNWHGNLKK